MKIITNCNICQDTALEKTARGFECKNCGSNIASYIPGDQEIDEYYKKFNEKFQSGGRINHGNKRALMRAKYYLEKINNIMKHKMDILDIGCSNSPFPNLAFDNGKNVDVVDYIKPKKLKCGIGYFQSAIDSEAWATEINKKYDIITLFDVIEHCRCPNKTVKNINETLNELGCVFITTPLCNTFGDKYAIGTTKWLYPPEHLNIFSKKGMEKLFGLHGFELIFFEKFEYTVFRKILRNTYGIICGLQGLIIKLLLPEKWASAKKNKTNMVQDIGLYVFKRK